MAADLSLKDISTSLSLGVNDGVIAGYISARERTKKNMFVTETIKKL